MRKIVSFASTPNEAIKWSELGKYKRLSKEELYIYDFENIEEVHFIGSKKGENDYEIEETKWGIYINMEEAILLYICSWQTKEFQLLEKINKNIKCLDIRFTSINELDISEFDKINKLVLSNNRYLGLVNGIEKISGLRELYLNNSSIEKNPDLNNFPEIYVLNLSNTLISDLEGDEVRRNCKFLDLSNTKIKSCKTIQIFPNLRRLSLQETDIVSLKGIEQLKKLESLNCRDTRIETINEVMNLEALTSLNISYTNIKTLDKVMFPNTIRSLVMDGIGIKTIPVNICMLKNLRKLGISNMHLDSLPPEILDLQLNFNIDEEASEISQIRKDGFNFISIQGEAGSGKSALCKLLLEKEKMVLYTRAEKIAEVSSLEDIWGLDIGKTIEYLKKKKLYIYIDALEFIVDCSKTKMDLLQQIYEIVKGHNNIFIITSCRTCDRTAFVKIENIYQIKRYDIFLLSDKQIIKVAQKYKIVQKLWDAKGYVQLLRSPFYLNLLVKEIKDFKKISDIDGFRNLIWNDIMCMSGKTFPQGITHSAVREAIEKIVFNRAEKFLPGVRKEEIGEEIVNILQSENIITTCSNNTIRLKYDIFEDICFERFIDEKYDDCKNDFGIFFLNLEKMGRCIYRRYQIWVENKLFSKGNREKFLYKLLETDNIPSGWKVQTIVGIVKSNFCSELFEEYKYYFSNDLLHEFLRLTNIFSFETSILNFKYGNVYSQLKPIGMGRPCLINLIFNNGMYKEKSREKAILKLCTDYSQNPNICDEAEKSACQILQFFIEEKMKNSLKEKDFNLADGVNLCLMPIYSKRLNFRHGYKNPRPHFCNRSTLIIHI